MVFVATCYWCGAKTDIGNTKEAAKNSLERMNECPNCHTTKKDYRGAKGWVRMISGN